MVSRSWCFTVNNPTPGTEDLFEQSEHKYLCYGREIAPNTGTPHLQGVITFPNPCRLSQLRSRFGSIAHWEVCRSLEASTRYCKKEGDFYESDNRNRSGRKKKAYAVACSPHSSAVTQPASIDPWDDDELWMRFYQRFLQTQLPPLK